MPFQFKQFSVIDNMSSIKVGTDAVLLGVWAGNGRVNRILEIGCGSGVISLMMAQRFPNAQIHAIDIHLPSVEEASQNFMASPWAEQLSTEEVSLQNYTTKTKYDLIISNPPFFNDSLPPQTADKTMAKHTGNLNHAELAEYSAKLLLPEGSLNLILPKESHKNFNTHAIDNGLQLWQQMIITPKEGKTPNRILSEWRLQKGELKVSTLTIRNKDNTYSEEYIKLTKEFYLAL